MLSKGLSHTATQITASIHADLQQIGARIEVIEQKSDQAILRINQNTSRIQDLQDQLESATSKIDDLENRSRRYNFRLRGLPESVKDTHMAVQDFIKSLFRLTAWSSTEPTGRYNHLVPTVCHETSS